MTLNLSPSQTLDIPINEGSTRKRELMGDDCIVLKFSLSEPANIGLGAWAVWGGERFYLTQPTGPKYNTNTGVYDYELQLDAQYLRWRNRVMCFAPEVGAREASWSLTDRIEAHAKMLLRNIKAGWWFTDDDHVRQPEHIDYNGESRPWTYSIDPDNVSGEMKCITYDNISIPDALSSIAETFACEWWITENVIHFGKCEQGESVDFEIGRNLSEMTPAQSRDSHATRIYPFGSTRNIPDRYGKTCLFEVTDMLPAEDVWHATMSRGGEERITISDRTRPMKGEYLQGENRAGCKYRIPQAETANYVNIDTDGTITQPSDKGTGLSLCSWQTARRVIPVADLVHSGKYRLYNANRAYKFTFSQTCAYATPDTFRPHENIETITIRLTLASTSRPSPFADSHWPETWGSVTFSIEKPETTWNRYKGSLTGLYHSTTDVGVTEWWPISSSDPLSFLIDVFIEAAINIPQAVIIEEITVKGFKGSMKIEAPAYDLTENVRDLTLVTDRETPAILNLATGGIELPASQALQMGDRFTIKELLTEKTPLHYFTEDSYIRSGLSTTNSFAERRLSLPPVWRDGAGFVEYGDTSDKDDKGKWNGQTPYAYTTTPADGIVEQIVTFEDIFPTLAGQQIDEVWTYEVYIKDPDTNLPTTQTATRYLVRVGVFDKTSKEREDAFLATGSELQMTFNSGLLCGRTFSLEARYGGTTIKGTIDGLHHGYTQADKVPDDYTLYELVEVEENDITTPNNILRPNTGDKVTFFGYNPVFFAEGTTAVEEAERKLLAAALTFLDKAHQDPLTYTCKLFVDVAHKLNDQREQYPIGQRVTLKDNFLFAEGERASRILGFELPLDLPWDNPTYTVGESSQYSRLGAMQEQIDGLKGQNLTTALYGSGNGGNSRISIGEDDKRLLIDDIDKATVKYADDISEEAKKQFLRRDQDETTEYSFTASRLTAESITIGGIEITVQNGVLVVGGNLAATGGVTALQQ